MKHIESLMNRFITWAKAPTGNHGTGLKPDEEILALLRSIDRRLAKLEGCVKPGAHHKSHTSHIVTGHWND
jgi:hypothetical protein